jgi:hypothetical protein
MPVLLRSDWGEPPDLLEMTLGRRQRSSGPELYFLSDLIRYPCLSFSNLYFSFNNNLAYFFFFRPTSNIRNLIISSNSNTTLRPIEPRCDRP